MKKKGKWRFTPYDDGWIPIKGSYPKNGAQYWADLWSLRMDGFEYRIFEHPGYNAKKPGRTSYWVVAKRKLLVNQEVLELVD